MALLDRGRPHRLFRRLTGARLEALLSGALPGKKETGAIADATTEPGEGAESAESTD